jgi:hypothetical protein
MADIVKRIMYEGDNSTFVWKSPIEDFNTGSQLIVHETQEAVFFMNGQALDLFGPGTHTLETQNIPLIRKILSLPTDGVSPFHCEVYFINKTEQMAIKWGTDTQVMYTEPTYNFPLKIGASGEMSLRAEDSRKLLVKLVGTENYLGQAQLTAMFRSLLMAKVKPTLAETLRSGQINIFDVDSQMEILSDSLQQKLLPYFADYGLSLERFFVTTIARPDGEPAYERFKDLHVRQYADVAEAQLRQKVGVIDQQTEAQRMVIEAQGLAQKRQLEGYTFQQEQSFEVSKLAAQNEGAGNFSAAGIGLGMMGGIAGGMGAAVAGITTNAMAPGMMGAGMVPPSAQQPPQGQPPLDDMALLKQKIDKLKMMKEAGLLSDEEMEAEKKKLLSSL